MEINERIYGKKEDWNDLFVSSYNANVTRDNRLLFANFGENQCVFGYAVYNNIIPNTVIPDKSLCYCAADKNCEFFKLTWYDKNKNKLFEETPEEYNNFSIQISSYDSFQDQFEPNNYVYSPANNGVISGRGYSYSQNYGNTAGYRVLTQIPFQNLVWLITVSAYSANDVGTRVVNVTFKYYLEHYKSSYPNIYEVRVIPFTRYNANNNRVTFSSYNVQNNRFFNLINFNKFKYLDGKTVHGVTVNDDGYILDAELYRAYGEGSYPYACCIKLIGRISHGYESSYDSIYSSCLEIKTFGNNKRLCMPSTDENIEKIYKTVAYLGAFFTDDETTAQSGALNSVNMYLGIIDENGITHGDYSKGTENEKQNNYSWKTNNESPYNPDNPNPKKERDSGDLTTTLNNFYLTNGARYYVLSYNTYIALQNFLNTAFRPDTEQLSQLFKGRTPFEYITTALKFPFEIPRNSFDENIVIGGVGVTNVNVWTPETLGTPITAPTLKRDLSDYVFDFGNIVITKKYNDFRDYPPFTKCQIQLPFASNYDVDLPNFYGHSLGIKYIVDFTTGALTVLILRDNLVIDTIDGICAATIALSGTAQNDYQNNIANLVFAKNNMIYDTVSAVGGGILSGASGDVGGVVQSALSGARDLINVGQTEYRIENASIKNNIVSTASTQNAFALDMRARLIYTHHYSADNFNAETYGKTHGFACVASGTVSDFKGYNVISDIRLDGIECTAGEKAEIVNIMRNGYINNFE